MQINLGTVAAGTHMLALGGYNNKKSYPDEFVEILIDDLLLTDVVAAPPSITTQPANLTVTAPGAANFSVVATGDAPLSYQWRRYGVNISGATSSSYSLNPTAVSDSGEFSVVVSNASGSVTSATATLTVNPAPVPPSITSQPANVTVTAPAAANFSVAANGDTPMSYQWRRNGVDIGGAINASYTLNPTAVTDNGAQFSVVVSNAAGTVTSAAATLTVNAASTPPSITTQPANVTVTAPAAANFSVVATGDAPLAYQWRRNGANISGATSASYSLNPTSLADNGAQFDVVVSNGAGTVTSTAATLTVTERRWCSRPDFRRPFQHERRRVRLCGRFVPRNRLSRHTPAVITSRLAASLAGRCGSLSAGSTIRRLSTCLAAGSAASLWLRRGRSHSLSGIG